VLLAVRGCGHGDGDGEDDDPGVMLNRDDDDGGAQVPTLGACHGGADLGPTPTCGGGYHGAEHSEHVSSARPASAPVHDGDDGSDEGTEHQHCGGGQG
jgi:hypothetical protein